MLQLAIQDKSASHFFRLTRGILNLQSTRYLFRDQIPLIVQRSSPPPLDALQLDRIKVN